MALLGRTVQEREHHARRTSEAMIGVAKARQCPACQRKMALKDIKDDFYFTGTPILVAQVCRWCKHWIQILPKAEEPG